MYVKKLTEKKKSWKKLIKKSTVLGRKSVSHDTTQLIVFFHLCPHSLISFPRLHPKEIANACTIFVVFFCKYGSIVFPAIMVLICFSTSIHSGLHSDNDCEEKLMIKRVQQHGAAIFFLSLSLSSF